METWHHTGAVRGHANGSGLAGARFAAGKLAGRQAQTADHCHATGTFRGVLDHDCNLGLGNFHDDPLRLAGAIVYLTRGDSAALCAAISRLEAALA